MSFSTGISRVALQLGHLGHLRIAVHMPQAHTGMQSFDMGCHIGVAMHDGFHWLACDSAHMHTQKYNWDYRGSKPDWEPKRSDSWGKLECRKKEEWLQHVHELCDNQCTVVIAFVVYQAQGCTQYNHTADFSIVFQKRTRGKKVTERVMRIFRD